MSKKIPDNFIKSFDWTVTSDKKSTESLSKKTKIIIEQLDKNPIPDKNVDHPKKNPL
jgi:mRNA-degrading endonuclease YafQ of YafQ-DinJ toxin-antitoxin module